jgi:signal transduction histidine kinase/pSer/pThr/pTyr-binding forkhead associated (FHA) protein
MIATVALTPTLRVLRGLTSGRTFSLDHDAVLLGRDPSCDITLKSPTVSRRHARIDRRAGEYYLHDLGSTSGTVLNGRLIEGPVCLKDGDVLEVGDTLLIFSGSPAPELPGRSSGESTVLKVRDATSSAEHDLIAIRPELKLRAMLEISRDLVGTLDLEHVLGKALDALFRIFPQAERGFVTLAQEGKTDLVPKAIKVRDGDEQVLVSRTIFDYVTKLGKAVLSADVAVDRRFDGSRSADEARIRTMMCVPLRDHERRPVGILQLDTTDRKARFGPEDLDLLAAIAGQISVAVDNARLLDEARGRQARLEDLAQAAEAARLQAEEAGRAKDRFLAMLSHELRTPLTPAILAITGLLDDPSTPGPLRPDLEAARRGIMLEARLVDDLLDLTRIGSGKLRIQSERVEVHALVHQALAACRDHLTDRALIVELELGASATHVEADPARFQQILWNLIKNAIKFTPDPGTITIRTTNRAATEPGRPDRMVLEVRDTGIGIAPEMLPRIFNVFEQGGDEVTLRFGGLGLGLAISRAVAELHGGTLSAASEGLGRGSTFCLELDVAPALPAAGTSTPADGQADRSGTAIRILLVEDNSDTLKVMTRLLTRRGYQVAAAANLAAALACAETAEFDLLISDIGLPDGSGFDLLPKLCARRPIPGIALSGYGMESDLRRSVEAGYVAHLIKPVDVAALEAAIRKHINVGD